MTKIDFVIDYNDNSILISYRKKLRPDRVYTTLDKQGYIIDVVFTEYVNENYFELKKA